VLTDQVLMIRPRWFAFDEETAGSNVFQQRETGVSPEGLAQQAREEFDRLAGALDTAGVGVVVAEDRADVRTPDSVFPNNWLSFHASGHAVLYPMATASRRVEVRAELIQDVERATGARWSRRVDLTPLAARGAFVEGTGSLVFDHHTPLAFACRSARTTDDGLDAVERELGVETLRFTARDACGTPYYHTNVMMAVGEDAAIVCGESIDAAERDAVLSRLGAGGRRLVEITREQAARFAGNALMLRSRGGDPLVVMSEQARAAFTPEQRRVLAETGELVWADIATIERVGGGSARCMIAEIHSPDE